MTFNEFKQSLSNDAPPQFDNILLKALWLDGKGNWEASHHVAQEVETPDGSWVHAYLHRKEGDVGNASYWYHRARRKMPAFSLDEEWEQIVKEFLQS